MANVVKIVHTADLHLGSPFGYFPERAEVLQADQLRTFMSIIRLCQDTKSDLLLIAGDLFEQPRPPMSLVNEVHGLFASIPETRVFIAPGNHDPAEPDSLWQGTSWSPNVHVFLNGIEAVDLPHLNTRVYGAAFQGTAAPEPLVKALLPEPHPDLINILLLHGEIISGNQGSAYNPISNQWLKTCGADYIALGHTHQGELVQRLEGMGPWYAYSGCPSGRGFDELGQKCVLSGVLTQMEQTGAALSANGRRFRILADMDRYPISGRQFLALPVNIGNCLDQEAIFQTILQTAQQNGPDWRDHLYKVILSGAVSDDLLPGSLLLLQRLQQELFFCKVMNRATRAYDLRGLAKEQSLIGGFVRRILSNAEPDWDCLSVQQRQVLQIGLQAFEREVPYGEDD